MYVSLKTSLYSILPSDSLKVLSIVNSMFIGNHAAYAGGGAYICIGNSPSYSRKSVPRL